MDMVNLHGLMEKVTRVNMLKMKNRAKADLTMEMDRFTKVIGIKVDNMEEENSKIKTEKYMKEDTSMVS